MSALFIVLLAIGRVVHADVDEKANAKTQEAVLANLWDAPGQVEVLNSPEDDRFPTVPRQTEVGQADGLVRSTAIGAGNAGGGKPPGGAAARAHTFSHFTADRLAYRSMLAQRIHGIALGYADGHDHQTLRNDPIMQLLAEAAPDPDDPLASPSTLCRFENWVNRKSLARMSEVFVDQFTASYPQPLEEIILDFNDTEDRVRGDQEGKFFHGYP